MLVRPDYQDIEWQVRKELFMVVFWLVFNMNSVLSGLSFNLFVNMKFECRLGNSLVFV